MGLSEFLNQNWATILVAALGLAAIYLLLPRPKRHSTLAGSALALVALVCAGAFLVRIPSITLESLLFYFFSGVAVLSAGIMVTNTNPARAALAFTLVVMASCGIFLLLAAPFLAAATIIVYAGAIIVTFLFVLMLSQQSGLTDADARSREPALVCITGFILLVTVISVIKRESATNPDEVVAHLQAVHDLRAEAKTIRETTPQNVEQGQKKLVRAFRFVNECDSKRAEFLKWWDAKDKWIREQQKQTGNDGFLSSFRTSGKNLKDGYLDLIQGINGVRNALDDELDPENRFDDLADRMKVFTNTLPANQDKAEVDNAIKAVDEALAKLEVRLARIVKQGDELESRLVSPYLEIKASAGTGETSGLHRVTKLSDMSGAPGGSTSARLRYNKQGVPHLPGNNPAFLGKSLFSDYLLAVELGGALLLVATIAAIVIAMRRNAQTNSEKASPSGDAS